MSLEERFWAKVETNGPLLRPDLGPCWIWTGKIGRDGYGRIGSGGHRGRTLLSHRVALELRSGPILAGLRVLHRCDHHSCVRPDHLFVGTQKDNLRDMVNKGRQSRGTDRWNARLTPSDVMDIRRLYSRGLATQDQLAQLYGIVQSAISNIIHRRRWTWLDVEMSTIVALEGPNLRMPRADVLSEPDIPEAERAEFRAAVESMARAWLRGAAREIAVPR